MELAIAKLAVSSLSPAITMLASYAHESYFGGDVTTKELKNLIKVFLPTMKSIIMAVELTDPTEWNLWLKSLQDAVFEAEDLLDLHEYENIQKKVIPPDAIQQIWDNNKDKVGAVLFKTTSRTVLQKLQELADEAVKLFPVIEFAGKIYELEQKQKNPETSPGTSTASTNPYSLFGREKECSHIINLLLNESNNGSGTSANRIPIISIVGMGGSGKTAIAQEVYNDKRVEEHFDLMMWIYVSRIFDVHRLTNEILGSTGNGRSLKGLDMLQKELKYLISNRKNFLLVLDDVWCEDKDEWDQLLTPLQVGGKGSKIIMTTQFLKVEMKLRTNYIVSLQDLNLEDCWSIMNYHAYGDSKYLIQNRDLEEIGNKIIKKVRSSPLALKNAGRLLGEKKLEEREWDIILQGDLLDVTRKVLLSSFQHLPSRLQCCFGYCSLFPKGYIFESGTYRSDNILIPLWIAQGFIIKGESELTLEQIANGYFEDLVSYSFFQKQSKGSYFIHDLFHDLAERVSKDRCYRIEDSNIESFEIPSTCIHLTINLKKDMVKENRFDITKFRKLRTLIILDDAHRTKFFKGEKDIFENLTKLRALSVAFDLQKEVLTNAGIHKLKHLRYIDVPYDKKLPKSLVKLYHLQFCYLNVYRYSDPNQLKTKILPSGFGNLINLRTLFFDVYDCRNKFDCYNVYSGINIEKLTSLQILMAFCPKKGKGNGMSLLRNLKDLRGIISIINLENVQTKADAAEAKLNENKNLDILRFIWSMNYDSSNYCEEVAEGLEPNHNLKMLAFDGYQGLKAPTWMTTENQLRNLQKLTFASCNRLKEISHLPLGLKELDIMGCGELTQLPSVGETLRTLRLQDCPKLTLPSIMSADCQLQRIEIIQCPKDENQFLDKQQDLTHLQSVLLDGSGLQSFPRLSSSVNVVAIYNCSELTCVRNLRYCTSLRKLHIMNCPKLMEDESETSTAERDMGEHLPCVDFFSTDEPSLLPRLNHLLRSVTFFSFRHVHKITSWELPQNYFTQLTSIEHLHFNCCVTIPNLENLSSLEKLCIMDCPRVEFLPQLPSSLKSLRITESPKLKQNYEEGGLKHDTIHHIATKLFYD